MAAPGDMGALHDEAVAVALVNLHDAYQRGNRDGLLSFANHLRDQAALYEAECSRVRAYRPGSYAHELVNRTRLVQITLLRDLETAARRAAEALPMDPEVPDDV